MNKEIIALVKRMGLSYVGIGDKMYYHGMIGEEKATYDHRTDNFFFCALWGEDSGADIKNPTTDELINLVYRYTGERFDITPKRTKRKEIDELKVQVAKMQDAIKSQNEVIDKLKEGKSLKDIDVSFIGRFADKLNAAIKESENQAEEKKGFEVSDLVVLSKDLLKEPITEEVREAVNLKTVFEVLRIENDVFILDKQLHKGETWTMQAHDLEHAPAAPKEKALEYWGKATIAYDDDCLEEYKRFRKGDVVFLAVQAMDNSWYCYHENKKNHDWISADRLKPL